MSGVKAGWYPDYGDPDGQLRYWDGTRWTEERMPIGPTGERAARELDRGPSLRWVYVAAAVALAVLVVALAVSALDDDGDGDETGSDRPATQTPSESPTQASSEPTRPWEVVGVVDSVTIALADGSTVRLRGLEPATSGECEAEASEVLESLVMDEEVTLVQKGPDLDAAGNLLRYVDRDGLDVGLQMIQRGLVTASDEAHPRAVQYHRVDDRTSDPCT